MANCENCGAPLKDGARYCEFCGSEIEHKNENNTNFNNGGINITINRGTPFSSDSSDVKINLSNTTNGFPNAETFKNFNNFNTIGYDYRTGKPIKQQTSTNFSSSTGNSHTVSHTVQTVQTSQSSVSQPNAATQFVNFDNSGYSVSPKSKWLDFILALFLGFLGIHKFYEGKFLMGLLYMFTFGLFYIGWIADIILILINRATDKNGLPIIQ